jgi:glycerol uptake facilitator-like aquaporin
MTPHLNPAVTLSDAIERGIVWPDALAYIGVQCTGGIVGARNRAECQD